MLRIRLGSTELVGRLPRAVNNFVRPSSLFVHFQVLIVGSCLRNVSSLVSTRTLYRLTAIHSGRCERVIEDTARLHAARAKRRSSRRALNFFNFLSASTDWARRLGFGVVQLLFFESLIASYRKPPQTQASAATRDNVAQSLESSFSAHSLPLLA